MARHIHDRIAECRAQQDNELWHLLILEELVAESGQRRPRIRFCWLPQLVAFGYYQLSLLLAHDERGVHNRESEEQMGRPRFS